MHKCQHVSSCQRKLKRRGKQKPQYSPSEICIMLTIMRSQKAKQDIVTSNHYFILLYISSSSSKSFQLSANIPLTNGKQQSTDIHNIPKTENHFSALLNTCLISSAPFCKSVHNDLHKVNPPFMQTRAHFKCSVFTHCMFTV